MIRRQDIITWYTPKEKLPEEGYIVLVTFSSKGQYITHDHDLDFAYWLADKGWILQLHDSDDLIIHAWCDIEPYKG